ncbi:MAG: TonB-dependent receptor [Bacteroidia bacterium]
MTLFSLSSFLRQWLTTAIVFTLIPSAIYAQTSLRGRVFDASHQQALTGVSIRTTDAAEMTFSGPDGKFEIPVRQFPAIIIVSLSGYQTDTVSVSGKDDFIGIPLTASIGDIDEVVLSAFFSGRTLLEQSGGVAVLGEKELHRDAPIIIAPALNRIPGVFMQSGTINTNRITIRGIGSRSLFGTNKIRAYLNEIPLTGGDGETTIEDIDLSLINRVEVLKGPASSIYGAGLGGTINLSTGKPDYRRMKLSTETMAGSFGLLRNVTTWEQSGDQGSLLINFNNTHSDGYRENNSLDRQSVTIMGQSYGSEKDMVSVIASLISMKAFIPSSIDSTTFTDNPQAAAFTWNKTKGYEDYTKAFAGISHLHNFTSSVSHNFSFFGSFRNSWEPRPFNILSEQNQSYGLRNRLVISGNAGNIPFKLQAGGEYFSETYDWQTYINVGGLGGLGAILSNNNESRTYYNLFAQTEWALTEKTLLTAGLNFNHTRYLLSDRFTPDSVDQSGEYSFSPTLSPRLSINHRLSPHTALHMSASHGFSPPSLAETLTPEGLINNDIQPETGWNFEVGSRGRLLGERLFYDISLYSMQIRNLLVARRVGNDEFVGVNAGKTDHNGMELALQYQIVNTRAVALDVFTTYTLTRYRFQEFVDGEADYSGNILTGTPPQVFNAGIDFSATWGLYANANFLYVDAMPMRDDNTRYTQAYQVVNLKMGFRKDILKTLTADLYGGIANALDERYAGMILVNAAGVGANQPRYYYPALPRNFFAGIKLSWLLR